MKAYPLQESPISVPRFHEENGFYTSARISKQMSKIRSKNTKPERLLRRALYAHGIRFRMFSKTLSGHPDISIHKYKLAVFVDGEFWHGYNWEERKQQIKSNRDFWIPKIERNMQRDRQVNERLTMLGYTVIRFWQGDIQKNLGSCVQAVLSHCAKSQDPGQFFHSESP